MSEKNNKRAMTTAVKALIATASVAATIAGGQCCRPTTQRRQWEREREQEQV